MSSPAHDPPGERVLDGGEVEPAFPGPQVGNVGNPEHVRGRGTELPLDEIVGDADAGNPERGLASLLGNEPGEADLAH